jgi:hypothetical protein
MPMSEGDTRSQVQRAAMHARMRLRALAIELRDDVDAIGDDPRTSALFATTAHLLETLEQAFADAQDGFVETDNGRCPDEQKAADRNRVVCPSPVHPRNVAIAGGDRLARPVPTSS